MSCVIPALEIIRILLTPELVKMREKFEDDRMDIIRRSRGAPKPEVAIKKTDGASSSRLSNDANPTHREDFTRLLGAAARKPAQED
jgi:hypothetical protein